MTSTTLLDRRLWPPAADSAAARSLWYGPRTPTEAQQAFAADQRYDRPWLAATLDAYAADIGSDPASREQCRRLASPRASVVITGQQAGLLTGPLYTVYKIITAIKLAAQLEATSGDPVIPVFWNATEDHDLSEIASFHYPDSSYTAAFPDDGRAAEALPLAPCRAVLEAYLRDTAESQHHQALRDLVNVAGKDYGQFSSGVVARLFRGTGLVILEPRLLRPQFPHFLERCLVERAAIREALTAGQARLEAAGLTPAFPPDASGTGLFHLDAIGRRRRIDEAESGGLRIADELLTEAALRQQIADTPEAFSTGAFLRPVLQALAVPALAYVAGPGEFLYHLQLPPLFASLDAPLPVLWPRNHATILGSRELRLAEQLGLEPADIFRGASHFHRRLSLPDKQQQAFAGARDAFSHVVETLQNGVGDLLHPKTLEGFAATVDRDLTRLCKKCEKAYSRAMGIDNARVDRFFASVLPHTGPQERYLNIMYFVDMLGPGILADLMTSLDPYERQHYVLSVSHD